MDLKAELVAIQSRFPDRVIDISSSLATALCLLPLFQARKGDEAYAGDQDFWMGVDLIFWWSASQQRWRFFPSKAGRVIEKGKELGLWT
jgi:hypothetical protein